MKQIILHFARYSFILILLITFFSSCVPQKKIKLLQRKVEQDTAKYHSARFDSNYRFKVKDNLYIRLNSLDPNASLFMNKSGSNNYNDYANDASIYLNSYTIDEEGKIEFPVIGKVFVLGKTETETQKVLDSLVKDYIREATVVVKLVNFKITVIGEVNRPGEFTFYQNRVNLFSVIAMAGDMTEWANRNKIALIRKTSTGSFVKYLDITQADILTSDYYYLKPNDIIYISPLGYKRWGLGSVFPWAFIFTTLSTTLLLINYFK